MIVFILQMRKLKLRRANKVLEAILLGSGQMFNLNLSPANLKACTLSNKQEMSHSSSDGFPGEGCLSSQWSVLIF